MNNELDIEAIRQSPRQFVDLETVIALSDRCMVLALQADEVNAARIYLREKGRLLTELAEKNAEIERLERLADAIDKRAGERIAASQARELCAAPVPAAVQDDVVKDAERYRWLRDRLAIEDIDLLVSEFFGTPDEAESVKTDAAIDAEMQKGGA